ncbi:MAG: hypothetical protein V3V09_07190 [Arenicellales bacterium]
MLLLLSFLSACTSTPSAKPESQYYTLEIQKDISLKAVQQTIYLSNGALGKGGRYDTYCKLRTRNDTKNPRVIKSGHYAVKRITRRIVQDDVTLMPVFLRQYRFSDHPFSDPILDQENVFSVTRIQLEDDQNTLTCFQEYDAWFSAQNISLAQINQSLGDWAKLSVVSALK